MKDDGWDNVPEPPAEDIDDILDRASGFERDPSPDQIHADYYGETRQDARMDDLYALTEAWEWTEANEGGDDE